MRTLLLAMRPRIWSAINLPGAWRIDAWIADELLVSDLRTRGEVQRVDPTSGRRELCRRILPRDPTGIMTMSPGALSQDGE